MSTAFGNGSGTATTPGASKTSFAWGLAAGVGVDVTPQVAVDVGYRYLDLGKVETGRGEARLGGAPFGTVAPVTAALNVHVLSVGLRYTL